MDSPTERMPIACTQCAKAKAKCDKKVPCSRCVSKQIVCQSRATRRSSQNPNKRTTLQRANSERILQTSAAFHIQLPNYSPSAQDLHNFSPNANISPRPIPVHRHSTSDIGHSIPIDQAMLGPELDSHMFPTTFSHTPPDFNMPITPLMANMSQMEAFMQMNGPQFDPDGDGQYFGMAIHNGMIDFDANLMTDFITPPSTLQDSSEHYITSEKGPGPAPCHMPIPISGSAFVPSRLESDSPLHPITYKSGSGSGSSPSTSSASSGLEPDAVLASHQAWPFFQPNIIEKKYTFFPPKTASIYLEGLAQTLRNQATWHKWTCQLDDTSLSIATERTIFIEPIAGWSREKLLAITQGFLHKALEIHKAGRDEIQSSPYSGHGAFLMLPPPEVMQYFLRSYTVRYEPYYSSIAGGRLDPNLLMHSTNSKAASLLVLLMVASGATASATKEARYLASGLTEACRISLFDTIEKDVSQAREVLILRSALLFTCLAAWSGDKWHMDMAMGQRGMYLAMLKHAGMLDLSGSHINVDECKLDPERAWEDWREHEGRHRLAHSWIIVDQEMSLFSDTTPLLSVVDLHAPVPDSDDLWHSTSATEWLDLFEKTHGAAYRSQVSIRDFFTKFVDGELADQRLSPTQLRLLLHPLQAQVCQLRQFIACLPDGGNHHKASRAVSKAATKARLEEISTLLQQWYAISRQSFLGNKGTCWTTCANLIMYHLISLNAITSFKCIEQFGRREVLFGAARQVAWLRTRCIDQPEETFFHCGQILRLIRSMPEPVRPPWWAGAVYRVALTAWAASMAGSAHHYSSNESDHDFSGQFAIDGLTPEHESISRYLKYQEGKPMLTNDNGQLVPLSIPSNVLLHCVEVLDNDSSMRLADGIKRKLRLFVDNWKDN